MHLRFLSRAPRVLLFVCPLLRTLDQPSRTSPHNPPQVNFFFGQGQPDCIFDANSIIHYFEFGRPFWMSTVILVAYLLICHILTFGAMLVASRRERR